MAQTPSSSAGAKEAARGTGEPPLEAWTSEGYYSRNCLPGAAKFETIIEKMKGINVSSVDGVERAIDSIKLARCCVYQKYTDMDNFWSGYHRFHTWGHVGCSTTEEGMGEGAPAVGGGAPFSGPAPFCSSSKLSYVDIYV
ncbi:unnamed protein product [Urochloa humidicola]